jgi:hypothetical protein
MRGRHHASKPAFETTKANTHTMDTHHDEIGRPRREAHDDHDPVMPGKPDRRGFLKIGGLSFGMAALGAACVQQTPVVDTMAETGTLVPTPTTLVPPFTGSKAFDATLMLTALSLERLAVQTYDNLLQANFISTQAVVGVAKAFRDQHAEQAGLIATHVTDLGQDPSLVKANEQINSDVVAPAIAALKAETSDKVKLETDALTLASTIEDGAAQIYAKAGGTFTTPELRAAITAIGAVGARRYTVLAMVLGEPPAPFAFEHVAPTSVPVTSYIQGK